MDTVCLIACSKTKLHYAAPARELYQGQLFRKSLRYAEEVLRADATYVLSARFGLLRLRDEIHPYDRTLLGMNSKSRRRWGVEIAGKLGKRHDLHKTLFVVLAGAAYREYLLPHLPHEHVPMTGLGYGEQLQWLDRHLDVFTRKQ